MRTPTLAARPLLTRTAWNGTAQVLPQAVTLLVTPVLLVHLGGDRFGVWALVLSLLGVIMAVDGGLGAAVLRYVAVHRAGDDAAATTRLLVTAMALLLAAAAVLTVVVAVAAAPLAGLVDASPAVTAEAVDVFRLIGPLVALALFGNLIVGVLQGHGRYGATALVAVVSSAAFVTALGLAVRGGATLTEVAAATGVRLGVTVLVAGGLAARHVDWRHLRFLRSTERREVFSYAARAQAASAAAIVNGQADALIVAVLLPVRYVGIYAIGLQAAVAIRSLPLWAMNPMLSQLSTAFAETSVDGAVRAYERAQRWWQRTVIGYALIGAAAVGFGVRAWLGPDLTGAGVVAAVLTFAYAANLATVPATCLARAIGRPGLETRYGAVAMVVNIAATVPLAVAFGLPGVVAGTALGHVVGCVYFLRLTAQAFGTTSRPVEGRVAVGAAVAVAVTVLAELAVVGIADAGSGLPLTVAAAVLGLTVFAGCTWPRAGAQPWSRSKAALRIPRA